MKKLLFVFVILFAGCSVIDTQIDKSDIAKIIQLAKGDINPDVVQDNASYVYIPKINGSINPNVTQENINSTICVSGYTKTIRPSTSKTNRIKVNLIDEYGFADKNLSSYELDHCVSLELGGATLDLNNLWPESYAGEYGARVKDKLENYLHRLVCNGSITLAEAQKEICPNWILYYDLYHHEGKI